MDKTPINAVNIKVVKLINGEELICHIPKGTAQTEEKSPLLRLDRPLQVRYVPQISPHGFRDYIALVKWAAYSDDKIITIPKDKILTITNASKGMVNSYTNMATNYSKINNPSKSDKIFETMRVDEDPEELRELAEDLREDFKEIFNKTAKKRTLH
jgi:hypothetical protein